MPGATLVDIWSISDAAALDFRLAAFLEVTWDFLAGVTENSFESGGIILTERATRSLLLQFINKKLEKFEFGTSAGCNSRAPDTSDQQKNLPQREDCLLGLERLVVSELDYVRDRGEQGLVHMHLGVGVDAVVADVEELNDLGFWELFDDAFATALIFNELTGNLKQRKERDDIGERLSRSKEVDWEPTFFIDLIRGLFAITPPAKDWVLLFMLSECSLNFLYFQLLTLSSQPPFYNPHFFLSPWLNQYLNFIKNQPKKCNRLPQSRPHTQTGLKPLQHATFI